MDLVLHVLSVKCVRGLRKKTERRQTHKGKGVGSQIPQEEPGQLDVHTQKEGGGPVLQHHHQGNLLRRVTDLNIRVKTIKL